jgi:hypothetical protein
MCTDEIPAPGPQRPQIHGELDLERHVNLGWSVMMGVIVPVNLTTGRCCGGRRPVIVGFTSMSIGGHATRGNREQKRHGRRPAPETPEANGAKQKSRRHGKDKGAEALVVRSRRQRGYVRHPQPRFATLFAGPRNRERKLPCRPGNWSRVTARRHGVRRKARPPDAAIRQGPKHGDARIVERRAVLGIREPHLEETTPSLGQHDSRIRSIIRGRYALAGPDGCELRGLFPSVGTFVSPRRPRADAKEQQEHPCQADQMKRHAP